jgi:hypothetical protein
MTHKEMFESAKKRPLNHYKLSPQEQWDIDKKLGILDWEGPRTPEELKELQKIFCKKENNDVRRTNNGKKQKEITGRKNSRSCR